MDKIKQNIVKTVLSFGFGDVYDYIAPEELGVEVGDVLEVPFGRGKRIALAINKTDTSAIALEKLKSVEKVLGKKIFNNDMLTFMEKTASYNLLAFSQVLKMAMPVQDAFKPICKTKAVEDIIFEEPVLSKDDIILSPKQAEAAKLISDKIGKGYQTTLLKGLTGSGKTEVYFEALKTALKQSKEAQVLVMLPEIMLTGQCLERFKRKFEVTPAVWHSGLTPRQRRETWKGVNDGRVRVLVGARSALFLPYKNLQLIIVDEEHDQSYKQEEGPTYQARDMAVLRASIEKIPIILATATPSVETYANVKSGKYSLVQLPERYKGAKLPKINLIDMREDNPEKIEGERAWISNTLANKVSEALQNNRQAMLFLNRRGYAPLMLCGKCGHRICCPNCSSWLVWHKKENRLMCHYCNYNVLTPTECKECKAENSLIACGPGAERIFAEAKARWNDANIVLVTSDTLTSPALMSELIEDICAKKIDILVGTQILTKGHHFPSLTVVGVIDADLSLASDDMRAGERTYQLLSQVAGRAGREELEGEVFMQTYMPENEVLQAIAARDEEAFFAEETEARKLLLLPPFGKTASIIVSGKKEADTLAIAKQIVKVAPPPDFQVRVLGPAPAGMARINRQYRFRIFAKSPKNINLSLILKEWLTKIKLPSNIRVQVDIEPYSFM